ncbi:hypothetical protein ALP30_05118 [Pseudomonas syringae pv. primulae]|nr:hypothetical protein ALP30_05118 [Pseudomonas syringae pv. primulae]
MAATVHIKERTRGAAIVRTNPCTATAYCVIPTRSLAIGRRTRHGKECARHIHPARLILAGEHQLPRMRADPFRDDQQIKTLLVTALERDRHTRLIMLDRDNTITKAIESIGRRRLIQQTSKITAQHLKLSRRTIAVQTGQINLRRRTVVLIDPRKPRLAGIKVLHRLLKPHQTQHLPSRAAHIHILPTIAKGRRLLDDRDIAIALRQPPCRSAACDAGPGDKNAARAALDAFELVDKMASLKTIWLGGSGGIMHHVVVVSVAVGCSFVGGSGCGVMKGLLASACRGRWMICVAGRPQLDAPYPCEYHGARAAPVAQLDRVLPSEGRGRGFESRLVHHLLFPCVHEGWRYCQKYLLVLKVGFAMNLPCSSVARVVGMAIIGSHGTVFVKHSGKRGFAVKAI